ncbi:Gfo/Idh/MocA family protein [Tsuneonella mangrovi]|uniref:Gfo/Idh/MocA family protein n=1 Tax=Tsuneonella mangrovi TaxID=1982042 RepID=UPI000BA27480|nr:Gfo/Idh/MocA family oxidoreductase [Tsuneonella mangrovi]
MTAPVKLAIVGLGKIAHDQHLPAVAKSKAFDLVATVDRAGEGEPDLPFFRSIEELVASGIEVDAVSVCTPPQVRHDVAQQALDQGWHVLLEKPPGATLAEVVALRESAAERKLTLFTAWHSQFARGVEPATAWLADKTIRSARIVWREDVRVWHPGQAWIWKSGGFGVFDPGINALSIITRILPRPLFVESSALQFPSNLGAPIAAQMTLRDRRDVTIDMDLDFRQEGPQHWDIFVDTDGGELRLAKGGAELFIGGEQVHAEEGDLAGEYPGIYRRFLALIRAGISDVDVSPLRLVADAFLCGAITSVEEFHE